MSIFGGLFGSAATPKAVVPGAGEPGSGAPVSPKSSGEGAINTAVSSAGASGLAANAAASSSSSATLSDKGVSVVTAKELAKSGETDDVKEEGVKRKIKKPFNTATKTAIEEVLANAKKAEAALAQSSAKLKSLLDGENETGEGTVKCNPCRRVLSAVSNGISACTSRLPACPAPISACAKKVGSIASPVVNGVSCVGNWVASKVTARNVMISVGVATTAVFLAVVLGNAGIVPPICPDTATVAAATRNGVSPAPTPAVAAAAQGWFQKIGESLHNVGDKLSGSWVTNNIVTNNIVTNNPVTRGMLGAARRAFGA